ncbi:hypothetical protein [Clostridium sp.]|uniref:hypothetical protein n=1 Tax=Clostridium sp. TaxID=1506 RepID=UPI0035A0697A
MESTLEFDEAQTRKKLIDIMLKDAEWNIMDKESVKIELPLENHKGNGIFIRKEKGKFFLIELIVN